VNFKKQRDRGELLVEKARTLYDNFHKEVVLAAPKQTIIFGAIVQLMPIYMNISDMDTSDLNAALSVVINEKVVRKSQSISKDCELTVAPSKRPCVRNSFKIVSGDGRDRTGENIKYGQRFQLQCMASEQDPIVLYSGPKRCNLQQGVNATYLSHKNGELNLNLGLVHRSVSRKSRKCLGNNLILIFRKLTVPTTIYPWPIRIGSADTLIQNSVLKAKEKIYL